MNRTASTRAFALNPCPADPLGRQMVYMHMSSHYRRMYSAQSVVDSAAPSKRRNPRTGAVAGAHSHQQNFSSLVPTSKLGVAAKNNARHFQFPSQPSKKPLKHRPVAGVPEHPDAVLSFNLPVVGSQRPILSVGSVSAPCPVSRGSSTPRSSQLSPRSTRVNASDTGRNIRSRQSMRGDVGIAPSKQGQRLRLRDQPGTYLAKLNQLAKSSISKGEENTTFKPRILSSNVQSKLKNSPVYHPPRPKVTNRLKLEEKDGKRHTETPRSKVQSSPPGSSRDSAYNGGVSSGGESHLKARELALIQQKRRAWTSGNQKPMASEDHRPLGSPEGTIGDGRCDGGRAGSPAYSYFSSIVSTGSRGGTSDVGTNMDNRDHSGSFNEDIESQIEEDIHGEGTTPFGDESQYGDVSPDEDHIEVASRTEASCDTFEEDEDETRSQTVDVLAQFTPRTTRVVNKTIQVEEYLSAAKSPVHSLANATTSTGSLQRKASASTSASIVDDVKPRGAKSVGTVTADKYDDDLTTEKSRWPDTAYVRLIHAFTSDAVKRGVLTNKALKAIFHEHVTANQHTLDMDRMLEEWEKFRINLDIPKEDHELTANYGLGKVTWNRTDYLDPLISEPSDLWDESIGIIPRPTLFLPHSYPTNDVGTNISRPLDDSDANLLLKKIETELREIFDPVGIMGSFGLPSETRNTNYVSPYTVNKLVPRGVEKASSPILEPVYPQPRMDLECVCGKSVCVCTSVDKIQGYMDKWLRSSETTVEGASRRHSFPELQKVSRDALKNYGTRTPPVERCMEGTHLAPRMRIASSTKSVEAQEKPELLVLPEPETFQQEKKTVRISEDSNKNNKIREIRDKMVVCIFDQQHAFSSNDSVNEGIFGRKESGVSSVTSPDIDTTSFVIADDTLLSSPLTGTGTSERNQTNPRLCDEFSLSLIGSNFTPNLDVDEPFKVLEQHDVVKWLKANPNAPTASCE